MYGGGNLYLQSVRMWIHVLTVCHSFTYYRFRCVIVPEFLTAVDVLTIPSSLYPLNTGFSGTRSRAGRVVPWRTWCACAWGGPDPEPLGRQAPSPRRWRLQHQRKAIFYLTTHSTHYSLYNSTLAAICNTFIL